MNEKIKSVIDISDTMTLEELNATIEFLEAMSGYKNKLRDIMESL